MALLLVVDDDDQWRAVLADYLGRRGFEVLGLPGGAAAIEYFSDPSRPAPRLLLLDVMMPGMDGHETYHALQRFEQAGRVPVIVLSSKGWTKLVFEGRQRVAAFVEKPVEFPALEAVIRRVLAEAVP